MSRIKVLCSVLALCFVVTACDNKEEKAKAAIKQGNTLINEMNETKPGILVDSYRVSKMSKDELVAYENRLTRFIACGIEVFRLSGTQGVDPRGMGNLKMDVDMFKEVRADVHKRIKAKA